MCNLEEWSSRQFQECINSILYWYTITNGIDS